MEPITVRNTPDTEDVLKLLNPVLREGHLTSPWKDLFEQQPKKNKSLTVIGGGIQGIVAAYLATLEGYEVTLADRNPDPRKAENLSSGSTFSGEDSRYITIFEGHPYLKIAGYTEAMYPGMEQAFLTAASDGGWLSKAPEEFSELVQHWIKDKFAAHADQDGIKRLFDEYIKENRVSMQIWYEFMRQHPDIYDRINLKDEIVRLYDNEHLFKTARDSHEAAGVLKNTYNAEQLAREFPSYKAGVESGFIIGALTMEGITMRVQEMGKYLLDKLEDKGAQFAWNTEAQNIIYEGDRVAGIKTQDGRTLTSDHYAFYTGAYANPELFKESPVHGKVAGVEGYWVEWKNVSQEVLDGMGNMPNKIHGGKYHDAEGKERPVVDLNINIVTEKDGSNTLRIGSGYVGVGNYPFERTAESRDGTLKDIHWVVQKIFGEHYDAAMAKGDIINSDKVCVRSWTANDQPLNQVQYTTKNGIVSYHGGGNTGSTNDAWSQALSMVNAIKHLTPDSGITTREQINAGIRQFGMTEGQRQTALENRTSEFQSLVEAARVATNTAGKDNRGIQGFLK